MPEIFDKLSWVGESTYIRFLIDNLFLVSVKGLQYKFNSKWWPHISPKIIWPAIRRNEPSKWSATYITVFGDGKKDLSFFRKNCNESIPSFVTERISLFHIWICLKILCHLRKIWKKNIDEINCEELINHEMIEFRNNKSQSWTSKIQDMVLLRKLWIVVSSY